MPVLCMLYLCAHLDRSNVSFAAPGGLREDLNMSGLEYGVGSGAFHMSYTFLQLPSNLALERLGARCWLSTQIFVWGMVSACTAFVTGAHSFALARLLLGVAEAGYAPGVMLYLSQWFGKEARARSLAMLYMASPIAGLIGAPLSQGIMAAMEGVLGMRGWRWLFLLQGLPVALFGAGLVYARVPDSPHDAPWLTPRQRTALLRYLAADGAHPGRRAGLAGVCKTLREPRTWGLVLLA
eukprot:Hpha_TRINITY_DN4641_c0_g2::TRINITY_DN4641_c0_g2_i1::g.97178::m.97178